MEDAPTLQPPGTHAERAVRSRPVVLVGLCVAALVLTTSVRGALAAGLPLLEAEAYYWLWSDRLAWGFYDHPPGVAVSILAGTALLGDTELGVRLGSVVLGTLGLGAFYLLCRRLVPPRAALLALLLATLAPFWVVLSIVTTPDSPLLFGWVISLLLFHRAVTRDTWLDWLGAGVATGLTILSKYNGFQLPAVFLVYLATGARGRAQLRTLKPWVALVVAVGLVLPNLIWNAGHQAESLRTPLRAGFEWTQAPVHLGLFVLTPVLLLSPVAAWAWITGAWRGWRSGDAVEDDGFRFLLCAALVPLAAFAAVALVTEIHAHWISTALVGAIPLAFHPRVGRRLQQASVAVAAGTTVLLLGTPLLVPAVAAGRVERGDLGAGPDEVDVRDVAPVTRFAIELRGWDALRERIAAEVAARTRPGRPVFLGSKNYHTASALGWAARGRLPVFPLERRVRQQFRYWSKERDFRGQDALVVEKRPSASREHLLGEVFEHVEVLEPVRVELAGRSLARFHLYWCTNYRGTPRRGGSRRPADGSESGDLRGSDGKGGRRDASTPGSRADAARSGVDSRSPSHGGSDGSGSRRGEAGD